MTIDAAEADWMNAHTDLALHGPAIAKKRAAARAKLARPTALPRMSDEAFVDLYCDQWREHSPVADAATLEALPGYWAASRANDAAQAEYRVAQRSATAYSATGRAKLAVKVKLEAEARKQAADRAERDLLVARAALDAAAAVNNARYSTHPMIEALRDPASDVFTVAGNNLPRRTSNTVTTAAGETLTALHVAGPYAVTKALKGYRVFHRAAGLFIPAPRSQQGITYSDFHTLKAAREFMEALVEADILTDSPTPLDDDARPDAKRLIREFVQTYGEAPE